MTFKFRLIFFHHPIKNYTLWARLYNTQTLLYYNLYITHGVIEKHETITRGLMCISVLTSVMAGTISRCQNRFRSTLKRNPREGGLGALHYYVFFYY